MQKILVINVDSDLQRALVRVAHELKVELQSAQRWEDARQQLVLNHYDLVCLHYDDFRVEGLDSFILLDNILQKELTPGLLLLGASSARARQLSESLKSLQHTFEIGNANGSLETRLREMIGSMLEVAAAAQSNESFSGNFPGQEAAVNRAPGPIEMEVRLPQYREGSLERTTLTRLLYALEVHRSTGTLELRQQKLVRRYPFGNGQFIESKDPAYSDNTTLQSAFAWTHGEFSFEVRPQAVVGQTLNTHALIISGIRKNLGQRRVMESLMPLMKTYPVIVSAFWERQKSLLVWPELHSFMSLCTGHQTLEIVLSQMGTDVTAGFLAAYMARDTDLVFFRTEPTSRTVIVSYNGKTDANGSSSNVGNGASALHEEAERKKTKAYRAGTRDRIELEQELRSAYQTIQTSSLYEIFGVWEGCGRNVVKERFYVLVKEHHPDVYGGNVSDEVKRLAQLIFMKVKDVYSELMKIETVQTVADPSLKQQRMPVTPPLNFNQAVDRPVIEARRRPIDTPLATQLSMEQAAYLAGNHGFSRHNTTPIGLGREPSEVHPEFGKVGKEGVRDKERQDKMEQLAQRATRARTVSAAGLTLPSPPGCAQTSLGRSQTPASSGLPTSGIRTDGLKSTAQPSSAKDFFNEGFVLFRNSQFTEAMVWLGKAYEMEPEDGLYLTFYGYGLFLTDSDQREKSVELLNKALATNHRQAMPDAHLFLGRVLMVGNQLKRAREHFEYALQLNPGSVDVQRELRLVELRLKEQNEKGGFLKNLFKR